jgi:hypothetical protein
MRVYSKQKQEMRWRRGSGTSNESRKRDLCMHEFLRLRLESSNKVSACTAYCVEHGMRTSGWLEEEGIREPCIRVGERGLWGLPYTYRR